MEYPYHDSEPSHAHTFLWPVIEREISRAMPLLTGRRAFDLGCGNGATANRLSQLGCDVTGIDTSVSGIAHARNKFPSVRFENASAYDDLARIYGTFDLVLSLEVIEHCLDPRALLRTFVSLMAPNSLGLISTPYHGYFKNLAIALLGKMDRHFTAMWDGGHVKFFSISTLGALLKEAGIDDIRFDRVGRVPPLARSMVAICRKG
jgi:2-polyprenyl-3-methyl-5-hydroxy-6-metoxy-1,4-benzoquinol methylase